ncbi:UDP-3-O-(3-hydroxymyristoyl)glucosamine N-acyltransferase [Spongiibacter tropicus]|uniref:UDP-3-O-(3-hydroxymyristoyl)glucosamine N-acyltransferase n=1 Tax=Spongiibacter tropicus TaxID=454602 RepID=UPI003A98FF1B
MPDQKVLSLAEVAGLLGLSLHGDGQRQVRGIGALDSAQADQLSFLANAKYRRLLAETQAGAVIVHPDLLAEAQAADDDRVILVSDNPYLAYAKASALFEPLEKPRAGVHPSAVVESDQVHPSASIGANCVIEAGAEIGEGTVIAPGTVIGRGSQIGKYSYLHANVTVYHGVSIGDECIIHSGVVIGGDGFGFAPSKDGWVKIHQLGGVRIGNRVEVGANSCIDRGALNDTVIGDGVIMDDFTMIAHNVEVGEGTAMAACNQVAGSAKIGKHCTLAGNVGVVGHIQIADGVHLTARSLVTKSIDQVGTYSSGGSPLMETARWRKNSARFGKLDELYRQVQALEKQLKKLHEDKS